MFTTSTLGYPKVQTNRDPDIQRRSHLWRHFINWFVWLPDVIRNCWLWENVKFIHIFSIRHPWHFHLDQFGASHFDTIPAWSATVWCVFPVDVPKWTVIVNANVPCNFKNKVPVTSQDRHLLCQHLKLSDFQTPNNVILNFIVCKNPHQKKFVL